MAQDLTPQIKEWLDTEPEKRDFMEGATLLLRVSRNRILYANVTRNPARGASAIEYHLKKIYNQRLQQTTKEDLRSMLAQVDRIDRARGLSLPEGSSKKSELQRGKRADHDNLPQEIQQLYVENGTLIQKMRQCHLKLRSITPENSSCPDNDRYPFAKLLIEYDTLYRENWNKYDHYIIGTDPADTQLEIDPRSASRNAARICNLLLGKYMKSKDEALAVRIKEAYSKIDSPTANLQGKMRDAGLL